MTRNKKYTMFKLSNQSLNKLKLVEPKLKTLVEEVLKISPYDFTITEGLRTTEKQQELFKQNTLNKIITKCDGIKNKSKHQANKNGLSEAMDIMIYIPEIDKTTNKPTGKSIGILDKILY